MRNMKAVIREMFVALSTFKKKLVTSHTSNLTAHLKTLVQKTANTPQMSRCKEIIKLKAEINKVEMNGTIQRINKTKSWLFEKIRKIDKSLYKITKSQRENAKTMTETKRRPY